MIVGEDNGQQWRQVDPEGVDNDVGAIPPILGKVICAAGSHIALWNIAVPAEKRQQRPCAANGPHDEQADYSRGCSQRLPSHAFHNDTVAIVGYQRHGPDGYTTKQRAKESVQLAQEGTHDPSAVEAIQDHGREHGEHHHEIREGQIHHKHVGWSAQTLRRGEHIHYDEVARQRHHAAKRILQINGNTYRISDIHCLPQHGDDKANDPKPHGFQWRPLIPIGIHHVHNLRRHALSQAEIAAIPQMGICWKIQTNHGAAARSSLEDFVLLKVSKCVHYLPLSISLAPDWTRMPCAQTVGPPLYAAQRKST